MSKKKVLFLCTGNSCRSQMAEGFARYYRQDDVEPYSAGIEAHGINGDAVRVMAELGIDISDQRSRQTNELKGISFDLVVTVCGHAHENCPILPGCKHVVHIGFDDPPKIAGEIAVAGGSRDKQLDCYRRVRDEIKEFVQSFDFNSDISQVETDC